MKFRKYLGGNKKAAEILFLDVSIQFRPQKEEKRRQINLIG